MQNLPPKWLWAIAIAGCLAAISLAVIHFREKPPLLPQAVRYQIRLPDKVTFTSGGTFSVSPDGRHVAFSASGSWRQPLSLGAGISDALEARELPDTTHGA